MPPKVILTTTEYSGHELRCRQLSPEQKSKSYKDLEQALLEEADRQRMAKRMKTGSTEPEPGVDSTGSQDGKAQTVTIRIPTKKPVRASKGRGVLNAATRGVHELTPPQSDRRVPSGRSTHRSSTPKSRPIRNTSYLRTVLHSPTPCSPNEPPPEPLASTSKVSMDEMRQYFEDQLRVYDLQQDTYREFLQRSLEDIMEEKFKAAERKLEEIFDELRFASKMLGKDKRAAQRQTQRIVREVDRLYAKMRRAGIAASDRPRRPLSKILWPDLVTLDEVRRSRNRNRKKRLDCKPRQKFADWRRNPDSINNGLVPPPVDTSRRVRTHGADRLPRLHIETPSFRAHEGAHEGRVDAGGYDHLEGRVNRDAHHHPRARAESALAKRPRDEEGPQDSIVRPQRFKRARTDTGSRSRVGSRGSSNTVP